jgi:hypothetical protein
MWHGIKQFFLYGDIYQFTSGPVLVVGVLATMYRRHVCHEHHCFRFGHPDPEAGMQPCCRVHHSHFENDK